MGASVSPTTMTRTEMSRLTSVSADVQTTCGAPESQGRADRALQSRVEPMGAIRHPGAEYLAPRFGIRVGAQRASRITTVLVGVLMLTASLSAIEVASVRWLNFTLAFGLFFATWTLPHATIITPWNNAIAALLIFAMSLVPSQDMSARLRASSSRRHAPRA